jgi:hypothetical protein
MVTTEFCREDNGEKMADFHHVHSLWSLHGFPTWYQWLGLGIISSIALYGWWKIRRM